MTILDQLAAALLPHLAELAAVAIASAIVPLVARLWAALGVQMTDAHRDRLAAAIPRAIAAAVDRGVADTAIAAEAAAYLRATMPDTLRALQASPDQVLRRVEAEIAARLRATGPAAPR